MQKEMRMRQRKKKQKLRKEDPFELPDMEFRNLYRFPKPLCREIVNEVVPFLKPPKRRTAISQDRKVLAALRFFAVGCYQRAIGQDINVAMSQATMSMEEIRIARDDDEEDNEEGSNDEEGNNIEDHQADIRSLLYRAFLYFFCTEQDFSGKKLQIL
uniref:Uncharacterized protein n=1 Tax=Phlebotomus papatasi TaxID=29031 RepID=A0A1B0DJD8_PHLPP